MSKKTNTEFDIKFEILDTVFQVQGKYGDKMTEKMKREINTMLYSKDCYNFGYGIGDDWYRNPLTSNCKGALRTKRLKE